MLFYYFPRLSNSITEQIVMKYWQKWWRCSDSRRWQRRKHWKDISKYDFISISRIFPTLYYIYTITLRYRYVDLPLSGKYMVSSRTENWVPGMVSKHWNTVSGCSSSIDNILLTDTSNKPSFSTVTVVVSPLSWYLMRE